MDSIMNFKTLHFLVKVECDLLCTCFALYSELTARFRKPNANWKEPEKIQLFFFFPSHYEKALCKYIFTYFPG